MPGYPPRVNTLFQLYLNNEITHDEYRELLALLNVDTIESSLAAELKILWVQAKDHPMALPCEEWDKKIQSLIQQHAEEVVSPAPLPKLTTWHKLRWAAAAIFLLFFSTGIYYLLKTSGSTSAPGNILAKLDTAKGIMPGGNKAVLILADGTSIVLDSASNGTIASQGTTRIVKSNTGQLVYHSSHADPNIILYNTLSTPRGGQYHVTLPDGTIVWLNSASSLRYPTAFTGVERRVEITGEAYFEVAKNPSKPFKVNVAGKSEVEVLGTHFNINSYVDEATINTTLLEGSVKVTGLASHTSQFIIPGQQAKLDANGQISLNKIVDLTEVMAWKNGMFNFNNADLQTVLRQLSRWYDVDIVYEGTIPQREFEGKMERGLNLLQVLKILEKNNVRFKIKKKKLIVME